MAYFRPTQQLKEHRMELNWKKSEQSGDFPYLVDLHGIEIVTSFLSGILAAPSSFTQQTCFYHGGYMLYSCSSSCTRKLCFWTKSAISSKFRGGQIKEWHDPGKIPSKRINQLNAISTNSMIQCHYWEDEHQHFISSSPPHTIQSTNGLRLKQTLCLRMGWTSKRHASQAWTGNIEPKSIKVQFYHAKGMNTLHL